MTNATTTTIDITATITALGIDSTVEDHNAIDADIHVDGTYVCQVTLIRTVNGQTDPEGAYSTWGSTGHWCSDYEAVERVGVEALTLSQIQDFDGEAESADDVTWRDLAELAADTTSALVDDIESAVNAAFAVRLASAVAK